MNGKSKASAKELWEQFGAKAPDDEMPPDTSVRWAVWEAFVLLAEWPSSGTGDPKTFVPDLPGAGGAEVTNHLFGKSGLEALADMVQEVSFKLANIAEDMRREATTLDPD